MLDLIYGEFRPEHHEMKSVPDVMLSGAELVSMLAGKIAYVVDHPEYRAKLNMSDDQMETFLATLADVHNIILENCQFLMVMAGELDIPGADV